MLYQLKRHPLAVTAHFEHCLVLTYAFPEEVLRPLLPRGLQLDTLGATSDLGFLAIALVQTRGLRPEGLPAWLGQDFFLSGYRIFARFRGPKRTLRGLRILRSDTDRPLMRWAGNLLTHYHYRRANVAVQSRPGQLEFCIRTPGAEADLDVMAEIADVPAALPAGSCFANLKEARRFAGPLPYTFDYEPETDSIVAIRATRKDWNPISVHVEVRKATFLDGLGLRDATPKLASAFYVSDVPYCWERGVRYPLKGGRT